MGAGKTFVGRRLAQELGFPFLDLDEVIERHNQASIPELFTTHGENYFRHVEARTLRRAADLPLYVMATGGGTPSFDDNMAFMNRRGTTIFLDVDHQMLVYRLEEANAHRPLLDGQNVHEVVTRKMVERRPTYEKAHHQLRIDSPETDVVRLIQERLGIRPRH